MIRQFLLLSLLFLPFMLSSVEAKTLDPYKVLGVDKSASQRDIQKAFHKLSLQYHPDKNKKKGAQEKFAEINNAYEILSDEEKRKNYDLYGDEQGKPGFGGGDFGSHDGHTYFTNGGPGSGHFTSGPGGWQSMGSQGNSKSFSFSFGGDPGFSGNPFGFDIGGMFSNFFSGGMKGGNNYGGFSGSTGANYGSESMVEDINSQLYNKQIRDQGMTWLLLFYTPSSRGYHMLESIAEDVAGLLHGAVKVGKINCISEQNLCKDLGVSPSKSAKLFVYSYRSGERGSLVEYTDNLDARTLKTFCQDHLPRFSKRVDLGEFDFSAGNTGNHPEVLLLSAKTDTPVIWRALSGLYRKRFAFYDAEVHDVSHPMLKWLGVKALPAVVGKLANGEVHVLKTGIAVKDLKSGINELRTLLENFEKKNKKVASSQAKKPSQAESQGKGVPNLTATNMDTVCGEGTAVCIIGVFRSSKAKEMLEPVLYALSHETLVRRPDSGVAVSYSLLDARKQSAFLYSFDKAGYKSLDKLLVAYKPRKGKFAVNTDELTMEEAERFVSSVLNGDVRFSKIRQKPQLS